MRAFRLALATTALLLLGVADSAASRSPGDDPEARARAAHVLDLHETLEEINLFMDFEPMGCAPTSERRQICTWEGGASDESWKLLAPTLPSEEPISLVCELPLDGSPRTGDSCSVHPRRSNRNHWRISAPPSDRKYRTAKARRETRAEREKLQIEAQAILEGARTVLALSRLVGQGPDECAVEAGRRRCLWRADRSSHGHGTLATVILASLSKKVRLECWFPADGGPRKLESCTVEIGD